MAQNLCCSFAWDLQRLLERVSCSLKAVACLQLLQPRGTLPGCNSVAMCECYILKVNTNTNPSVRLLYTY